MKRILVAIAAVAFLTTGVALAADAPKGKIVLKQGENPKQGPVSFDHGSATHKAQKCETCHATAEGGKITPALDMKTGHAGCQKCHNDTAKADASKAAIKACTNCHAKKA